MDTLLQTGNPEKKGVNKILLVGILIGTLLVAGAVWLFSFTPSMEEQTQQLLADAFLEGSPEFEKYTKDIVIQTDMDNIMQSPTALGTIMMTINAKIRNKGQQTISGLEVKVGVVDMAGKVVREKKLMVVPKQREKLAPGETIPVVATVEGFRKDDDRANVRWKVTAIRIE
jgi:hypothetical protein